MHSQYVVELRRYIAIYVILDLGTHFVYKKTVTLSIDLLKRFHCHGFSI